MKHPEILHEDEDIIVVIKPSGMSSEGGKGLDLDMVSFLKTHLYEASKGGEPDPYIAPIHRLDKPVGGIMVYAKNQKAAANLSDQLQDGNIDKYYQAILCGELDEPEGRFEDYLIFDKKANVSKVVKKGTKNAKRAILEYEELDALETDKGIFTYALIRLLTGRHHQIRCQMAAHNLPIYGDRKYNSSKQTIKQIGLIATRLEFDHPTTNEHMVFKTEPWGEAFDILDAEEMW
ncbi:MAG: RluA family pseudouridine synthase [Lachnospiraceae bacterium]|nr:RluA family pseudouridine synthase [Lachnospiraceae bacterium]